MERNLTEILEGSIVNYCITSSERWDVDMNCRDYMYGSHSSLSGYVGVVRDGVFFDLSEQGATGRVNSYYDVEEYLDLDLCEDEYKEYSQWCFGVSGFSDLDAFAERIADCVAGRTRGSRVVLDAETSRWNFIKQSVVVDIWKDGEIIYSEEF